MSQDRDRRRMAEALSTPEGRRKLSESLCYALYGRRERWPRPIQWIPDIDIHEPGEDPPPTEPGEDK